jgi:hypothetical protein
MSHFPVLVIGEEPVKLLQPYHEFECTGTDDEYVQDIDETQDQREDYEASTEKMLVSPEGERFDYYDKRFYTGIPTDEQRARGLTDNYRVTPEGWEETEVPTKELKTFTQYVLGEAFEEEGEEPDYLLRPGDEKTGAHKYRFIELDEKDEVRRIVKRTNPNSHWDGWILGGRWSRFFKLKPEVELDLDNVGGGDLYTKDSWLFGRDSEEDRERYANNPHTIAERKRWVAELTEAHAVDHGRVKDLDFEAGRDRAEIRARAEFAKWREMFEEHGKPLPFQHFLDLRDVAVAKLKEQGIADEKVASLHESPHGGHRQVTREEQEMEHARRAYNAQPTIKAANKAHLCSYRTTPMELYGYDVEAYVAKMRNKAMVPYAVIKDGEWFARGKMHMFAFSDDNMTEEEWCAQVHKLYAELPEDALLTLVDCHV